MTNPNYRALCAELLDWLNFYNLSCNTDASTEQLNKAVACADKARAALAAAPVGEVAELVEELNQIAGSLNDDGFFHSCDQLWRAATLLEQLSAAAPAVVPIPVSERLPGPDDCAPWPDEPNATPWCWAGKDIDGGWEWAQISMLGLSTNTLGRIIAGGGWTHWLPAHAIPLPAPKETKQ